MRNIPALFLCLCILFACKGRKAEISADGDMDAEAFIATIPAFSPPFRLTDTALAREPSDSRLVNRELLKRFVPDSVTRGDFPKSARIRFHAIGAYTSPQSETYLVLRASSSDVTMAYLVCFDAGPAYRAALPVMRLPTTKGGAEMLMDGNLSIHVSRRQRTSRTMNEKGKDVYVYNSAGVFTLVMTDFAGQSVETGEVYNPIDTLPMKNPMSGDYFMNGSSLVAIRDGKLPGTLHFFIHMDREEGQCQGELRGELDVTGNGIAIYRKDDDHCSLAFEARSGNLTVRELSACGNHRGVNCAFEGSYRKRKKSSKTAPGP